MANATSGSERPPGERDDRIARLEVIAQIALRNLGLPLWFAEIVGKRWSYLAGVRQQDPSDGNVARIPLSPDLGMLVVGWGELDPGQQLEVIGFVRDLLGDHGGDPAGGYDAP